MMSGKQIPPTEEEQLKRALTLPPGWCRVLSAVERSLIRTLRIFAGVIIVRIAVWLFAEAVEVLEQPFSSLSPLALLGGILAGLGGLFLVVAAIGVAFGPAGESKVTATWRQHCWNKYLKDLKRQRQLLGYEE